LDKVGQFYELMSLLFLYLYSPFKMTHTDHPESHGVMEATPRLLYGLHDKPPFKDALFVALQHVCAIFIPVVTPGLLITGALGLEPAKASYIWGMSLFVFGIGTFIQVKKVGPIGSGLLSIQGTSFAFVTPILAIVAASLKDGKTPDQTLPRISVWQYAELVAGTCSVCDRGNLQR
jgi:xanthine permease XanP